MDWFKGQFTGKPHIQWENLWFPVDFPLNQSIEFTRMFDVFVFTEFSCVNLGQW